MIGVIATVSAHAGHGEQQPPRTTRRTACAGAVHVRVRAIACLSSADGDTPAAASGERLTGRGPRSATGARRRLHTRSAVRPRPPTPVRTCWTGGARSWRRGPTISLASVETRRPDRFAEALAHDRLAVMSQLIRTRPHPTLGNGAGPEGRSYWPRSWPHFGFVRCRTKPRPARSREVRSPQRGHLWPFRSDVDDFN